MSFKDRIQHAWNAFTRDPTDSMTMNNYVEYGISSPSRPNRTISRGGIDSTIIASIYNRIALDVCAVPIRHVRLDEHYNFKEIIHSKLDELFTLEANRDQTGRVFIHDLVMSMFDEGCVAIVPVETNISPTLTESYQIESMRVGKITNWYKDAVTVSVYNEDTMQAEEVTLPKKQVGIIENPLYAVMNEQNSTLKRLVRKLQLLDAIDDQVGAGKLDIIIQLPYSVKTTAKKALADERKAAIEDQLTHSKLGIAYIDATEKITQLNRPVDNTLMTQITYLYNTLYAQLGLTESIFNGTASEEELLSYYNRTLEPILAVIVDEIKRKFLTRTARAQLQSIMYLRDSFKLIPLSAMAEIGDKLTRNEILSSNEVRGKIGIEPSSDPKANDLRNKNIAAPPEANPPSKGVDIVQKPTKEEKLNEEI